MVKHFIIGGTVQGVGFRYFVKTEADQLGLYGWVRNVSNGTVECQVSGPADTIGKFEKLLWQGPTHAKVTDVRSKIMKEHEEIKHSFEITP